MNSNKRLIIFIIAFGSILRLCAFWISPPNNSYDDHLEVINLYAKDYSHPNPSDCWECYQPPLYYYIGASVYNTSLNIGINNKSSWKIVQLINPLLSILVMIMAYQILKLFEIKNYMTAISISFIAVIPRDIFTSSMIGNDYMLVFFSILSFLLYAIIIKKKIILKESIMYYFPMLVIATSLGSLTKQHGLLLNILPATICVFLIFKSKKKAIPYVFIMLIGSFLSLSNEVWKYEKTGEILVSNQHFFDYAKNQSPGNLENVEFNTLRMRELYKKPFLSESTSASFFTEIYARTLFDYEWRFFDPKIKATNSLGRLFYTLGLIWIILFILSLGLLMKKNLNQFKNIGIIQFLKYGIPLTLALLFCCVPIIQTIRYPYFSSMKSMFLLSGIIIFIILYSSLIKHFAIKKHIGYTVIAINISYGILLFISIIYFTNKSLESLSGPLWIIPQ